EWNDEWQKAFDTVKAYLVQPPVLVPPSPDRPLILYLTVRRQFIGCTLGQKDDSSHAERAIYYLSKKFNEGESNYPEIEKMCCALVWVIQRLRQYTLYHTICLLLKTDHLKYLLGSPSSMRNIAKWRCQLTKYDIKYVSRTSVKGQVIADHLAEFSIDDDTPIDSNFPDEEIIQLSDDEETPVAIDLKVKELEVFGDSMLTIFQTLKQWKTKYPKLVPYHEYLEELVKNFEKVSFTYKLRMKDQFADALATLASMVSITKENLIEPLEFKITQGPTHCDVIEAVNGKPWYADIKHLLQTDQFPHFTDRHDRRTLRYIAAHFFLSGETLYHRSFDGTLLRCVDGNEAQSLMEEVHEANCKPHMNGLMLAKKLMRLGYFWSTMETDCVKHVKHCHLCQVYANQIKAPPNELYPMAAPWPFSMWGMDVINPINPKASNGYLFILVAIDYFTKWIEAITIASVIAKAMARFLKRDIIARYGVPATLITDNAKNMNKLIDELCAQFRIQRHNSSPYRPQMNGAVEAVNKNIKKIIEKMMRMARAFNKKVRPREFSPCDLVLRKVLQVAPNSRGKFAYKYDGPFIVKEAFDGRAIILSDMDGNENALPVNVDALKKYYP
ncbi:hypothetical protein CRG98_008775, partial [Punica granatum]